MFDPEMTDSRSDVSNSLISDFVGLAVQAGTINGGVHIHLSPSSRFAGCGESVTGLMAIALGMDRLPDPVKRDQGCSVDAAAIDAIDLIATQLDAIAFRHGGGTVLAAFAGHLQGLGARSITACPAQLRPRFLMALANTATSAAWANYDTARYAEARSLWHLSLKLARSSAHSMSDDFFVRQLIALNHQAVHLGNFAEALQIMELALALSRMVASPTRCGHTSAPTTLWPTRPQGTPSPHSAHSRREWRCTTGRILRCATLGQTS